MTTFIGKTVILVGPQLRVGDTAPDFVLMAKVVKLSHATMRTIKQNLFWAFAYNVLGIPVAMGILHLFGGPLLNPMLAGAAMSLSSVSVLLNALRLKRVKM